MVLRDWYWGNAGSWTDQYLCMFKPLKDSVHPFTLSTDFFKEEEKNVLVEKGRKDAVAASLLIICPSAACLSTAERY